MFRSRLHSLFLGRNRPPPMVLADLRYSRSSSPPCHIPITIALRRRSVLRTNYSCHRTDSDGMRSHGHTRHRRSGRCCLPFRTFQLIATISAVLPRGHQQRHLRSWRPPSPAALVQKWEAETREGTNVMATEKRPTLTMPTWPFAPRGERPSPI